MFSGRAASVVSVISGPSAPESHPFALSLGLELPRVAGRLWLVESGAIARALGCQPLLPWRATQPLERQVIRTGEGLGLIHAPRCMAGDAGLVQAAMASRGCDVLLFDGGRFSLTEAPIDSSTVQTLVVLLGSLDAEAGYALLKALATAESPARVLLMGKAAAHVAQAACRFMRRRVECSPIEPGLCQIDNNPPETSSNTLSATANLKWVLSKISQNYQSRTAHGGGSKGAKKVC